MSSRSASNSSLYLWVDLFRNFFLVTAAKVFVANPNKSKAILDILLRNREKLIDFLTKFHTDRTGGQPQLNSGLDDPEIGEPVN